MNTRLLAAILTFIGSTSAYSTEAAFQFSGEVVVDNKTPLAYQVVVLPNRVVVIDAPGGLRLEVISPREDGPTAEAQIRLLKPQGQGEFVVLHQAHSAGPAKATRSISYRVCDGVVTFLTPAPVVSPNCASGM